MHRSFARAAALLASGMVTACGATGGTGGAGGYQGGRLQFGEPGPWPVANFTYGAANGIQETPVVGTSTDESQNLWVATPQALYLLRPGDGAFRRYDASDGLHFQSNPALYCGAIPAARGATSCPLGNEEYGAAKYPGITEIVGGGPNEVFVGYAGSEPVLDPNTGYDDADPGRHDGKIDRVRLNGDGTITVDRFDMLSNQHGRRYWHDRTIDRLVYDHFIYPHTLYSGSNHGVTMFLPDQFVYPSATLGFDASVNLWMGDHLHAQVCYHPVPGGACSLRVGDWRGLAIAPDGDLWHAGKWAAGKIRWSAIQDWYWTPRPDGSGNAIVPAFTGNLLFPAPQEGDAVNMTAVAVARDGTVWFATKSTGGGLDGLGYGIVTWSPGQGLVAYDPRDLGLPEYDVQDLVALPDGRVVLAGPSSGLAFYDPATGTSKSLRAGQGIPSGQVTRLEVDTMVDPPALHVSTAAGAAVLRVLP